MYDTYMMFSYECVLGEDYSDGLGPRSLRLYVAVSPSRPFSLHLWLLEHLSLSAQPRVLHPQPLSAGEEQV